MFYHCIFVILHSPKKEPSKKQTQLVLLVISVNIIIIKFIFTLSSCHHCFKWSIYFLSKKIRKENKQNWLFIINNRFTHCCLIQVIVFITILWLIKLTFWYEQHNTLISTGTGGNKEDRFDSRNLNQCM